MRTCCLCGNLAAPEGRNACLPCGIKLAPKGPQDTTCPACQAKAGEPCTALRGGGSLRGYHRERRRKTRRRAPDWTPA